MKLTCLGLGQRKKVAELDLQHNKGRIMFLTVPQVAGEASPRVELLQRQLDLPVTSGLRSDAGDEQFELLWAKDNLTYMQTEISLLERSVRVHR